MSLKSLQTRALVCSQQKMRGKALLVLPFAVFSFHTTYSHAADDALSGLPEISPDDLQAIASRLSSLASSETIKDVADQVGVGDEEVDTEFVKKALDTLSQLLSSTESRELLADLQRAPESIVRQLLKSTGGDDDEALQAVLAYFFSLRRVLQGNSYLRNQVNSLIQMNAEKLLTSSSFGEVLGSIASSTVFKDLKEEVEDDLQNTSGYLPVPDNGDEMSR